MQSNDLQRSQAGQMLLATGVVLLMSLLSMAIFGVKVAGLTLPHDAASDDVIVTTQEVLEVIEPLTQERTDLWMDGGLEGLEAAELALQTVHDDLLHHGEIRGVEIKSRRCRSHRLMLQPLLYRGNWGFRTEKPCSILT